jgi:hypothetical protein
MQNERKSNLRNNTAWLMLTNKYIFILCTALLLGGTSCSTQKAYYRNSYSSWNELQSPLVSDTLYSVILVGDARRIYQYPLLHHILKNHISEAGENSLVLFLGDNAHPRGLPDSTHKHWEIATASLASQLELIENFSGRTIFIPGNHDWAQGRREGLQYLKNQQDFIEAFLGHGNAFLPVDGSPGPVEVKLTDEITLIVIDSHWWFHPHEKSYEGIEDEGDFFIQIADVIKRNNMKHVIFAAHHPLFSAGLHGGHFPVKSNFFPLTEHNPRLYIPLPGFIYTGYRKFLGSVSDLTHPHYKVYKKSLLDAFTGTEDLIFVAGHDHNLQYASKPDLHHIISGSAGGAQYVAHNKKADYAQAKEGFARLTFLESGDVWLEYFVEPDDPDHTKAEAKTYGELTFRKKLFSKPFPDPEEYQEMIDGIDFSDSTVTVHPNGEIFKAGSIKQKFLGRNYREEWITAVEVPVFNFKTANRDLKIVQRGGGGQTKSLRMEDDEGRQWVLRSIDKDPSVSIPEIIRVGFAEDLVLDQMSASLPWAALAIPRISGAANIYHTNPQIVYLADDPRLGHYREDFADALYLFEERPANDRSDVESFGRSEKIRSTAKMIEKVEGNPKNRVDQKMFLRSRLVDMLISDWDRHEGQWRWAMFRQNDLNVYQPVPRDRDMAFYVNEGLLPWLSSRSFLLRKTQGLDHGIKDIAGLNYQAVHLDRRFLNELNLGSWIETAEWLTEEISDQIIDDAINDMPQQITQLNGDVIISKLKSRRNKLTEFAREYYMILAKEADVVGTGHPELFLIEKHEGDSVTVTVFTLDKEGIKDGIYFRRTFYYSETKEIRLFGLGGDDQFEITGNATGRIKIRIIPGEGNNRILNTLEAGRGASNAIVYDASKRNANLLQTEGNRIPLKRSEKYIYQYNVFKYNKLIPFPLLGYNVDDGIYFGAGLQYTTYGFMKDPYAGRHTFDIKYSMSVQAFEVKYDGLFTDAIGNIDLVVRTEFRDPRYTLNYYGLGNETDKQSEETDYHRVRIGQIFLNPGVGRKIGKHGYLSAGVFYQSLKVEETEGRYVSELQENGLTPEIFERKQYAGFITGFKWDSRNEAIFPARGIHFNIKSNLYHGLGDNDKAFNQTGADLGVFMGFRKPYRTVLAVRFGGSFNFSNYDFYHANSLGGRTNLRGFRDSRFAGDASVYNNAELRFRLTRVHTYMTRGSFGILIFNDIGRVWLEGENSDKWHHGYGGGFWLSPFNLAIVTLQYERSVDEKNGLLSIRTGFLF